MSSYGEAAAEVLKLFSWRQPAAQPATRVPEQLRHQQPSEQDTDPGPLWLDLSANSALRILDLARQMSSHMDSALRDQADPDVLDHLYALDSLTCQVRRCAENLHVLAGQALHDSDRQLTSLQDIIQAARGRIAGWQAVHVGQVASIAVGVEVASDVIRVVTELLDNAVRYSPAGGLVTVAGHLSTLDGGVLVRVQDTGVGLTADSLRLVNEFLASSEPGPVSVQQGFAVVRRVIRTSGIRVFLVSRPAAGTTAHILIPPTMLTEVPDGAEEPAGHAAPHQAPVRAQPPAAAVRHMGSAAVPEVLADGMPIRVPQTMRQPSPVPPPGSGRGPVGAAGLADFADFDAATRQGPI